MPKHAPTNGKHKGTFYKKVLEKYNKVYVKSGKKSRKNCKKYFLKASNVKIPKNSPAASIQIFFYGYKNKKSWFLCSPLAPTTQKCLQEMHTFVWAFERGADTFWRVLFAILVITRFEKRNVDMENVMKSEVIVISLASCQVFIWIWCRTTAPETLIKR